MFKNNGISMIQLDPQILHIWTTDLSLTSTQEDERKKVLSSDEMKRADQLRFPIHKTRFIAARTALRQILSLYLDVGPEDIRFGYGEHKKPYLLQPILPKFQFNLAHSADIAVYAFGLGMLIGIDIEKIEQAYKKDVAKRFFSQAENNTLAELSNSEQINTFYRIWAQKEAVLKAIGTGLSISLSSFSVNTGHEVATLLLENQSWFIYPLSIHPDYQAAVASDQKVKSMHIWQLIDQTPHLLKIVHLSEK